MKFNKYLKPMLCGLLFLLRGENWSMDNYLFKRRLYHHWYVNYLSKRRLYHHWYVNYLSKRRLYHHWYVSFELVNLSSDYNIPNNSWYMLCFPVKYFTGEIITSILEKNNEYTWVTPRWAPSLCEYARAKVRVHHAN